MAAIYDVDAPVASVPEDEGSGPSQIELDHRLADRQGGQGLPGLGDDDGVVVRFLLPLVIRRLDDRVGTLGCAAPLVAGRRAPVLDAALVAAKAFLDPDRRLIEASICVRSRARRFQRNA